jgi:hypothetical protein
MCFTSKLRRHFPIALNGDDDARADLEVSRELYPTNEDAFSAVSLGEWTERALMDVGTQRRIRERNL